MVSIGLPTLIFLALFLSFPSLKADPPGAPGYDADSGYHREVGGYYNGGAGTTSSTSSTSTSSTSTSTTSGSTTSGTTSGGDRDYGGEGGCCTFGSGYSSPSTGVYGGGQVSLSFGSSVESTSTSSIGSNIGYSMGTPVSVDTVSNQNTVGGIDSNGNEYYMGTPTNSTTNTGLAVFGSALMGLGQVLGISPAVEQMSDGLKQLADRLKEPVSRIANTAIQASRVALNAASAGAVNMRNSIRGTIGAGTVGYQEALDAAFYRGVKDYYDKNNITSRVVPTGPMSRVHGYQAVKNDPALQQIDDKFNNGTLSVVGERLGYTPDQVRAAVGTQAYSTLNSYEKYGVSKSVVVSGDLTSVPGAMSHGAIAEYSLTNGVGRITVDIANHTPEEVAGTLKHEARHAADFAVLDAVQRSLASEQASQELKDLAESIYNEMLDRAFGNWYSEDPESGSHLVTTDDKPLAESFPLDIYGSITGADTPRVERARNAVNYYFEVTEAMAYNSTPAQKDQWAGEMARALGITQQEARNLHEAISHEYQQDEIDRFVEEAVRSGL